jgi:hypothetical protein
MIQTWAFGMERNSSSRCVCNHLLGILLMVLTPTKAYRPGLPGKVVGHVESPLEIWVPLAHHDRALVKDMVSKYVTLYSTTHGWSSVEEVSAMLNFTGSRPPTLPPTCCPRASGRLCIRVRRSCNTSQLWTKYRQDPCIGRPRVYGRNWRCGHCRRQLPNFRQLA